MLFLLEELVPRHRGAGQQLRDHRHVIGELCACRSFGQLGIHRMGKRQRIGVDLRVPLVVDQRPGLGAGLALDVDGAGAGIGQVLHAAVGCGIDPEFGPEVGRFAQELEALGAQQYVVIGALLEIAVDIGLEHRIADLEPARLVPHPRAIDEAAGRVIERGRHDENRLGRAGQVVADLAGERGHGCKPDRHVGDRRGREARIDPVGHLDRDRRDHQHGVDQRRLDEPAEPGSPVEVHGGDEERVDQPHHHDDADQRLEPARTGPGGDRVEGVDEVVAAPDREDLEHEWRPYWTWLPSVREKRSAADI
jgi:hypothetical protein